MKITTAVVTNCGTALDMLAALRVIATIKMPPAGAFAVNKAMAILSGDPDVKAAEGVRMAALEKYGTEDGTGQYVMAAEKAKLFMREFGEVAFQQVVLQLPVLPKIVLERLMQSKLEIEPTLLGSLLPLWEDE